MTSPTRPTHPPSLTPPTAPPSAQQKLSLPPMEDRRGGDPEHNRWWSCPSSTYSTHSTLPSSILYAYILHLCLHTLFIFLSPSSQLSFNCFILFSSFLFFTFSQYPVFCSSFPALTLLFHLLMASIYIVFTFTLYNLISYSHFHIISTHFSSTYCSPFHSSCFSLPSFLRLASHPHNSSRS